MKKTELNKLIESTIQEIISEATSIDFMYIAKRLKEFNNTNRKEYDWDNLIDGVAIDLRIKDDNNRTKLKSYLHSIFAKDRFLNDNQLKGLAKKLIKTF